VNFDSFRALLQPLPSKEVCIWCLHSFFVVLTLVLLCWLSLYPWCGDSDAARHLWRRVPQHVRGNHPDIGAVWNLGKLLLAGDRQALFQAASSYEWEPLLAILNTKFLCTCPSSFSCPTCSHPEPQKRTTRLADPCDTSRFLFSCASPIPSPHAQFALQVLRQHYDVFYGQPTRNAGGGGSEMYAPLWGFPSCRVSSSPSTHTPLVWLSLTLPCSPPP